MLVMILKGNFYLFQKDGSPLPAGRYSLEGGNITIENIIESDRGIYSCMATNEAATIVSDTELLIENVAPRAPYNLSANSTDTAITLRWAPGEFKMWVVFEDSWEFLVIEGYLRPSLEYTVWYRLSDATEWRTMRVIPKHLMETTITHLESAREYEFMVLCQDTYGDGMFSKTYRFYTKRKYFIEMVPVNSTHTWELNVYSISAKEFKDPQELRDPIVPFSQIGPPRNVTVYLEEDGCYLVKWDTPEYGLDSLRYYIVRWWQEPKHTLHGTAETGENYYIGEEDEECLFWPFFNQILLYTFSAQFGRRWALSLPSLFSVHHRLRSWKQRIRNIHWTVSKNASASHWWNSSRIIPDSGHWCVHLHKEELHETLYRSGEWKDESMRKQNRETGKMLLSIFLTKIHSSSLCLIFN